MASTLLQAALSHFRSERDKALAGLNINLNQNTGQSGLSTLNEVIHLFEQLEKADSIIETIQEIIQGNEKQTMELIQGMQKNTEVASQITPEN